MGMGQKSNKNRWILNANDLDENGNGPYFHRKLLSLTTEM